MAQVLGPNRKWPVGDISWNAYTYEYISKNGRLPQSESVGEPPKNIEKT